MHRPRRLAAAVATLAIVTIGAGCGSDDAGVTAPTSTAAPVTATSVTPTSVTPTSVTPTAVTEASPTPDLGVATLRVDVVETVPHDMTAFTQGLLFDDTGSLYESTGLEGQSSLRLIDPDTGEVLRHVLLDPTLFAEGLALVGDRLIQLTWQDGVALVYDRDTFEQVGSFSYEGEGWGLCYDGDRLVMSDGTDVLEFRDPETFEVEGSVGVTLNGDVLELLNELECVDGKVYANLWRSDLIAVIEPDTGVVETLIDASSLARPAGADVLNGIAVDPEGGLWLTGKLWTSMYRVELVPAT